MNSLLDHNLAQLHNRIHIFAEKFDGLKHVFARTWVVLCMSQQNMWGPILEDKLFQKLNYVHNHKISLLLQKWGHTCL